MKTVKDYYRKRFPEEELKRKDILWKTLCVNFFNKYIKSDATVMDIGAGYCEFINNCKGKNKIAVDINPDTRRFAGKNVQIIDSVSTKIPQSFNKKADIIFMSNFLEHLSSKEEVIATLERCFEVLEDDGKIMILQPNITLTGNHYWDFIDHKTPLNVPSVIEALEITGFKTDLVVKRFLPYTTKSRFSNLSFLLEIYLMVPQIFRPFAGQSFFLASKK